MTAKKYTTMMAMSAPDSETSREGAVCSRKDRGSCAVIACTCPSEWTKVVNLSAADSGTDSGTARSVRAAQRRRLGTERSGPYRPGGFAHHQLRVDHDVVLDGGGLFRRGNQRVA